jgi:hypothetical protein
MRNWADALADKRNGTPQPNTVVSHTSIGAHVGLIAHGADRAECCAVAEPLLLARTRARGVVTSLYDCRQLR